MMENTVNHPRNGFVLVLLLVLEKPKNLLPFHGGVDV
jgi:hypothetical protein